MSDLMSIGEFATATWLSPKALRLYDRRGLLSPDRVDPFTGYSGYSDAQVDQARLISMLRRIDMSLEEIGELLALPPGYQAAYLGRYRR